MDESYSTRRREATHELELIEVNQALLIEAVRQDERELAAAKEIAKLHESQSARLIEERQIAIFEERTRLAREIHDTLAQAFTGILIQLRVAQRIAGDDPFEAWSIVEGCADLAQSGLAQARRSVWSLQPNADEFTDLVAALKAASERMCAGADVTFEVHVLGEPVALASSDGRDIVHIAQEALLNSLRHANAKSIMINLCFDRDCVIVSVQDDGIGFDATRAGGTGGFGLIGMAQRAARLGAEFHVFSSPGRGTEVAVSLPLNRKSQRDG